MKFFFRHLICHLICPPTRTLGLIVVMAMCSACGQKGKLVLPVKPAAISTPYPTAESQKADGDRASESETESKPAEVQTPEKSN